MEDSCMTKKNDLYHTAEIYTPTKLKFSVTAKAYLSATFGPKISDIFYLCLWILTFYSFILGKTILRSSKFEVIAIWNQQYMDKQKGQ